MGDRPLMDKFPRLYSLSMSKGRTVSEVREWVYFEGGEAFNWQLLWRRHMFEWEEVLRQQLVNLISSVEWKIGEPDGWVWERGNQNEYNAKLGYEVLLEDPYHPQYQWLKEVWALASKGNGLEGNVK